MRKLGRPVGTQERSALHWALLAVALRLKLIGKKAS